jgi:fucose 4-O-acetylase-like acetyltransferase
MDYAKGLLIALMVYGHVLSSARHAALDISRVFEQFSGATFASTLPLFFFLSGLMVERSYARRGPVRFLQDKLPQLVYPYLVWSVLQTSAEIISSRHSHSGATLADLLTMLYLPRAHFWFLPAMLWMMVTYVLVRQAREHSNWVLAVLALVLFFVPIPIAWFSLNAFSWHFIFFAAGVLSSRFFVGPQPVRDISLPLTLLLSCTFAVAAWYVFARRIGPVRLILGGHPYYYVCLATLGGAALMGWAQFLARRGWLVSLRLVGKYSMQIYVAHMLMAVASRIVLHDILGIDNPVAIVATGILAGLLGPVLLYKACRRFGLPNLFEWRGWQRPAPAGERAQP